MIISTKFPVSYIIRLAGKKVLLVTVFSTIIYLLSIPFDITISSFIPSLLGTAIALVLAFKLSQSYDRWWEARKIWGAIVNDSRTFAVQVQGFIKDSEEKELIANRMILRQVAWCYSLSDRLRNLDPIEKAKPYLALEKSTHYTEVHHPPYFLSALQQEDISKLRQENLINEFQEVSMNDTVRRLIDSMGKAERIKNTVFPTPYRLFHDVFIYMFLLAVSITISELKGVWQILISTVISIPFFLLERVGYMLQDPFENRPTDISVTSISDTIAKDLLSMTHNTGITFIPQAEKSKYYIN